MASIEVTSCSVHFVIFSLLASI